MRHYEYGEVILTAAGKSIPAISLHAAGGTWGTRDGVAYARGNDGPGRHRVRARLVDVGEGFAADYARAGDVTGRVVLVRRGNGWPTYPFIEAGRRGALALLMYDYPGGRDDALKQDSMWYHEQLPTASIRKADAKVLQDALASGAGRDRARESSRRRRRLLGERDRRRARQRSAGRMDHRVGAPRPLVQGSRRRLLGRRVDAGTRAGVHDRRLSTDDAA